MKIIDFFKTHQKLHGTNACSYFSFYHRINSKGRDVIEAIETPKIKQGGSIYRGRMAGTKIEYNTVNGKK